MRFIMGVDPGTRGGISIVSQHGCTYMAISMQKMTCRDIVDTVIEFNRNYSIISCTIEDVGCVMLPFTKSSPIVALKPTAKLNYSYGLLVGCINTLKIPLQRVRSKAWQNELSCNKTKSKKSDMKKITKAKAQELFPDTKITHDIADALLIAEYGRRMYNRNNGY